MARIVIALGGNALQKEGEASAAAQQQVARETAAQLVPLVAAGHQLVIVHGNGPQVGNIILGEEAINSAEVPSMPLDTCVAMSQGSIGYWLQQALNDEFSRRGLARQATTIVTQVEVDPNDPAFQAPSKPIGPFYHTEAEAQAAAQQRGFVVREDAGRGWRRVVASPRPQAVVELPSLRALIDADITTIVGGGGGIPVVRTAEGTHRGVEAVIDKDFSAAVVAAAVAADMLVILTAVPAVMVRFNTPEARALSDVTVADMQQYVSEGHFAAGSMLPKVLAACSFAEQAKGTAVIGALEEVAAVVAGEAGTRIRA